MTNRSPVPRSAMGPPPQPVQGKRAYDTDQYPAPAGSFDRPAPVLPLYHVRFPLAGLWPDAKGDDTILVELYGSWLEAA